jgi:P-type Cu+ transporter
VRDAQALETMRLVKVVAFDKTGTLTEGKPRLASVIAAEGEREDDVLAAAAALQAGSEHPLARAVLDAAARRGIAAPSATALRAAAGRGIEGVVGEGAAIDSVDVGGAAIDSVVAGGAALDSVVAGGAVSDSVVAGGAVSDSVVAEGAVFDSAVQAHTLRLGSTRWLEESAITPPTALQAAAQAARAQGHSVSWLFAANSGTVRGLFTFGDNAKPEAAQAIASLHAHGVRTVLVSGDNRGAAQAVARQLGIDDVRAEVLPGDKARVVAALRDGLGADDKVAMVGDGINDAPALAAADVGLAMSTGTDVAMESAGLTLMRGDVRLVAEALLLSRAVTRKIRQNLFWAFAYNVVGIPAAAFGLLTPVVAGAAMALSSVSVVANALLLRRWRP